MLGFVTAARFRGLSPIALLRNPRILHLASAFDVAPVIICCCGGSSPPCFGVFCNNLISTCLAVGGGPRGVGPGKGPGTGPAAAIRKSAASQPPFVVATFSEVPSLFGEAEASYCVQTVNSGPSPPVHCHLQLVVWATLSVEGNA